MKKEQYRSFRHLSDSLPECRKSTLTAREQIGGLRIVSSSAPKVSKEAKEWSYLHTTRRRAEAAKKRNAEKVKPLTHKAFAILKKAA